MPSLKDLKIRIESVKSTRKITKAMQMVAAAKLRRAQEGAESARPYAERMEAVLAQPRRRRRRQPVGAAAPRRHRPRPDPPPDRRHRRARPLRRLQLVDRAAGAHPDHAAAGRGQDGQDPDRRQEGPRAAAPRPRQAAHRPRRPLGGAQARLRRRGGDRPGHPASLRRRRVRRLHHLLQPLPVGDQPGPDRAPADPRGVRGARRRPPSRSTSTSRTRRRSSPISCRAASRPRSSPRCSRTPPPSRARAWGPWTTRPATPAT